MIMPASTGAMDNTRLDALIREIGTDIEGQPGFWQFNAFGVRLYCITDEGHDRMRIMTPISDLADVDDSTVMACMEANFDRALDARYCINNDAIWGAFMHPLSILRDDQFRSACSQVAQIALNFGSSYSSGELRFGD